jgi:hypothetical protein
VAQGFEIKVDRNQLKAIEKRLRGIERGANKVLSRSLNFGLSTYRTQSAKLVREELNLKASRIKKDYKSKRATQTNPDAKIVISSEPPGLGSFGKPEQVEAGVKVKIFRKRAPIVNPHAFLTKRKRVFRRAYTDRPGYIAKEPRDFPYAKMPHRFKYPLYRPTGPRVADYAQRRTVAQPSAKAANERINKELEEQTENILKGF